MSQRYTGPLRVRANSPDAQRYEDAARKLVGELELRGQPVGAAALTLPDGGTVSVQVAGSQKLATLQAPPPGAGAPGAMEEVVYLYVSADDGLHEYDLGTKTLARVITGLEPYTVHAVDAGIAYLSTVGGTGQLVTVRLDLGALTAFGYAYAVQTPDASGPVAGFATAFDAGGFTLSPDGSRALVHFGGSMTGTGAVKEGVGGYLLVDAATLAPLRAPIRMGFKPARCAWSADSQRFYLGVSAYDDPGDVVSDARLNTLTTATSDGVALFDRDGALLGSAALATWSFPASSGFVRLLQALGADDRYVYAATVPDVADSAGAPRLHVLGPTLAPLASLDLSAVAAVAPAQLVPVGATLYAVYADRIATLAIAADGTPSLQAVSVDSALATPAPARADVPATLRRGVTSRVGRPPDPRRFLFRQATGVHAVAGYLGFASPPAAVYTLDLEAIAPGRTWKTDFALANVGTRAIPGRRDGGVTSQ